MPEIQDNYLCFRAGGISYIVPVMEVERICTALDVQEKPELVWAELGADCGGLKADRACVVILKEKEQSYAVRTELVEGVVQIEPSCQFELPEVLQPKYPWLLGVSLQREEHRLLLLLDTASLALLAGGDD